MNKIFRVVWSYATQTWVVVSELTKAHKKMGKVKKIILGSIITSSVIGVSENVIAADLATASNLKKIAFANDYGTGARATTGQGSLAIGEEAGLKSTKDGWNTIAIGRNSRVGVTDGKEVNQSIAIGSGIKEDEGAWAKGDQSIAIGANTRADGDSSIAIGGDDVDKVVTKNITYTSSQDVPNTKTTLGKAFTDLTGKDLLSPKYQDTISGNAAIAVGVKATASDLSVAIGTLASAGTTPKDNHNVTFKYVNTVAIGSGATAILDNAIAIGGGSIASEENKGKKETHTTIKGVQYDWAGGDKIAAGDIVSFGKKGFERQLKNVAPGNVSSTSTDAINGSQLYGIAEKIITHNYLKYAGDDGQTESSKVISQSLDDNQLNILGGATGELSDNNIAVKFKARENANAKDKLQIKLAKNLTGLNSAEFKPSTTSDNPTPVTTKIDGSGITLTPSVANKQPIKLTQNGLNNGGNAIVNVAQNLPNTQNGAVGTATTNQSTPLTSGNNGVNSSNAATVGDILNAGWNLQEKGKAKDFVKAYDTVNFDDGLGTTVSVTTENNAALNKVSYSVKAADSTITVNAAGVKVTTGNIESDTGNNAGKVKVTNGDAGKIATLDSVVNAINNAAWKATSAKTTSGEVSGTKLQTVKAGDTVTFEADKNIKITQTNNKFTFATKDDVTFNSVQIGGNSGPKLTNTGDSLKVAKADGTTPTKITNIAAGEISDSSTDAINGSQFNQLASNKIKLSAINRIAGTDGKATHTNDQALNKKDGIEFKVKSADGELIEVKADGDTITLTPHKGSVQVVDGKATIQNGAKTTDGLVEASELVDALNKMGWKVTSDKEGSGEFAASGHQKTMPLVKSGETVTFKAGDNLKIKQAGKDFTYSLNPALSGLTSAEFKDAAGNKLNITPAGVTVTPITPNRSPITLNQNGLNNGGNHITNVSSNLPHTKNGAASVATTHQEAPKTTGEGNDVAKNDNAATVGDILNAGWNIQEKGTAKDFVKAYDVVNFDKGNGTEVSVTVSDEGKTSTVKYSVKPADKSLVVDENGVKVQTSDGIETTENGIKAKAGNGVVINNSGININTGKGLKIDSANGNKVAVDTDDSTITLDDNGKIKAVTGAIQPVDTTADGKKKGTVQAKNGDENKLVTVENVAQAVNSAKWFAKADNKQTAITDAEKTTSDSGESMAAGDELTFTAGKNLRVKRSGKEFVFATVEKPEFTGLTLKESGNVVNIAATEKGLNLGKPKAGSNTETDPVNITGVTSGLEQYNATTPKAAGLVNLNKTENNRPVVNNNTAATVGDLRNMGWIVSSDKTTDTLTTPYNAQVKNADEVRFIGAGTAVVSGKTEGNIRTITVKVDDQLSTNNAITPVVYTDEKGNTVYPTGKKDPQGNPIFNMRADGTGENVVGDVKTSINGPKGTDTPTTLSNVKSNLPDTINSNKANTADAPSNATQEQLLPTSVTTNNAATVGDILNSGWNLQGNGAKVDFVKAYDTVNFVNGDGTTATVESKDGKTSTVKYSVNLDNGLEKTADNKIKAKAGNGVTVDEKGININTGKGLKIDATDGNKLAVDTDGTTITTDADGKVKAVTGETDIITANVGSEKKGQVKPKDKDASKLVTVQAVVNAVNSAKWYAKAENNEELLSASDETQDTSDTAQAIGAGDELTLKAGKNLRVKRNGKDFTYALTPELKDLMSAEFKDAKGNTFNITPTGLTISKPADMAANLPEKRVTLNQDGLDNGGNAIKNVQSNLPDTINSNKANTADDPSNATQEQLLPTSVTTNNAATVGDILNAGWNLQGNGNKVDFVKAYDTVNFVNGDGTTATVESKDGKTSTVKYSVNKATISSDDANKGKVKADENGDKFATAENVANAINNAYWSAAAAGNGVTKDVADKVSSGSTVTFEAGKNLKVTHTANNFKFETADDVEFNSVQLGNQSGPKLSKDEKGNIQVGNQEGQPVKITGVADGEISATSTEAINGSQLHNLASNNIKLKAKNESETETSTDTQTLNQKEGIAFTLKSADGSLLDVLAKGNTITFTPKTAAISTENGQAKATTSGGNLVKADDLVVALNSMGWYATSDEDGGKFATEGHKKESQLIKAGETVTFKAGKNLTIKQSGKDFTYALTKALKDLSSAEFKTAGDNPVTTVIDGNGITIQAPKADGSDSTPKAVSVTKDGISAGDKAITNVASNLPNTVNTLVNSTKEQPLPTNVKNDNAATVGDILNAGWNLQGNGNKVDFVKAYDTVNFVNGDGTTATVESKDGKTSTVKYNVNLDNGLEKTADNKIKAKAGNGVTVDEKGININTGKGLKIDAADGNKLAVDTDGTTITTDADGKVKAITAETEVITSSNKAENEKVGQVKAKEADKAKLATVEAVAKAVNSAKWFAKADNKETAITDAEKTTSDNGESMAAGDELTLTAGKNLRVKREGKNFTFATVETPEFESLKLTKNGNTVNIAPTASGLNLSKGNKDNSPVNIAGVTSGLSNYVDAPKSGLRDLSNTAVTDNTAATVGDLRNMGWVVATSDNNYHDQVRNANQVDFVGSGLAKVSGETTKDGVRKITFSVQMGEVLKDNEFKAPDGTKLVKIGDNYYRQDDIDLTTGEPKVDVKPKYKAVGDKVLAVNPKDGTASGNDVTLANNNAGLVTGKQVAESIQQSGWNVGLANADKAVAAFGTGGKALSATDLEKVNPNDNVRFANGKNTIVKASTVTDIDVNGNKVTNTYIRTDINGLPIQYTNASGAPVTKIGDKFFTLDKDGNPTTTEVDAKDIATNLANPTAKPNEIGKATQLGNVANGANTFATPKDANGNKLVKANDGNWYKVGDVNANGTTVTGAKPATPAANSDPKAGLVDFANSNANNAATVGDLKNMGWVVSASDNDYNDQVRNTNKVDFKGGNGIEVKGETLADGTRQLTVGIKEGSVTNRVEITKEDGSKVDAVVIDGKYYERGTDGKPTNEITLGDKDTVSSNAGSGFVTGNTVANAINESGWNVGLADQTKADKAFADSTKALSANTLEKVNPDDNVRFANGKNTKVKAATVDEVNKDGKKVTNTYVKVDVDLPMSQISAVDATGNKVVKDADGNWYPAKADGTADKAQAKVDPTTIRQSTTLDPDGLGDKYSSTTNRASNLTPAQLGELVGKQTVAADKAADNVAKLLEGQPQAVVNAAKDAARKAAEDEVKTQYLKDNGLDTGTGGTVITNVAWGKAPSDAVNVDQLQNSGWNVDSRQVEGSNGKVISGNTAPTKVRMDETVNVDAGNNIEITRNGRDIAIATSMDPTFNTVKIGTGDNAVNLSNNNGALDVGGAKITNVAPGDISANSTDAINGAQIYALAGDQTNVTPASHSYINSNGDKVALADKTVVTDKDGEVYLRTYNVQGQEEIVTNNVLEAVHNINEQGIKFFHSNDGKKREKREDKNHFDSSAPGTFATAIASKASAEGENAVAIGVGTVVKGDNSISIGTGNKVNGHNSGAFGDPSIIDGHNSYSVGNNNTLPTDNTFVLGNNVTHTAENSVFLGTQSGYVDGVANANGSVNERASTTAGRRALTQQVTGGILNQYAGGKQNEVVGVVSVGTVSSDASGQKVQQTRRIQNVAPGLISERSTDAINGSQLYSIASGMNVRMGDLNNHINKVSKRADAGTASALATAQLPQAYIPGKNMIAAAGGNYQGQSGIALGMSSISDNGKVIIRLSGTANTQGKKGIAAGIGYQW